MRTRLAVLAAVAAMAITGCASSSSIPATPAPATSATTAPAAGNIVEVASSNADFSTLVAAIKAAGLVETLSSPGPYTVFAPTNDAFAALPAGVLDKLLLPANKEVLAQILTYHVVAGKVTSDMITAGSVTTVEGQDVEVTTDSGVKVNDATVTTADLEASNGVIHVIDAVLLPPGVDPSKL